MKILAYIKMHLILVSASIVIGVSVITVAIVLTMQASNEEIVEILEAGADTVPIINSEDLDVLGRTYSILNETFEREINELTMGLANRHNKMDKVLTHYGVYGKENVDPFKNLDYVNGIRITYDKTNANIRDGASNFNDIIAVMAVLYNQQMDMVPIDKLKETFTRLFWLSHTYTYNSDELYPCRHGCLAENNYKCTALYNDYKNTKYLKYELYTVPYHTEYVDLGYDEREDFRVVVPYHKCVVCGQKGAGCKWIESKVCYHGSTLTKFINCNLVVNTGEETVEYSEEGEEVVPEDVDPMYLVDAPTEGHFIKRTDRVCRYYKIIRKCNKREQFAEQLKAAIKTRDALTITYDEHNSECTYDGDGECPTCRSIYRSLEAKINEISRTRTKLEEHKKECEPKYWCDGYKLCMGHKDHYTCEGKHKVVLCSGHTNINVAIKVMYNKELLDEALKAFNENTGE